MKKVKIRFIEVSKNGEIGYYLQEKWLFWWGKAGKLVPVNKSEIWITYFEANKGYLLEKYLLENVKTDRKYIEIIEYPMLKQY